MGLFEKTPDLREHPDWENYGETRWKEKENRWRPFIGIPNLVRMAIQSEPIEK